MNFINRSIPTSKQRSSTNNLQKVLLMSNFCKPGFTPPVHHLSPVQYCTFLGTPFIDTDLFGDALNHSSSLQIADTHKQLSQSKYQVFFISPFILEWLNLVDYHNHCSYLGILCKLSRLTSKLLCLKTVNANAHDFFFLSSSSKQDV